MMILVTKEVVVIAIFQSERDALSIRGEKTADYLLLVTGHFFYPGQLTAINPLSMEQ